MEGAGLSGKPSTKLADFRLTLDPAAIVAAAKHLNLEEE